jgi:hypothetical protein
VTDPAQPAEQPQRATDPVVTAGGGYRFTPAEIQQQLIQCTDLLEKFETSHPLAAQLVASARSPAPDIADSVTQAATVAAVGRRAGQRIGSQTAFLRNWYDILIVARARYLEQEHLTEAQWNALAHEGLPE